MLCRLCGSAATRSESVGDADYLRCGDCGYIALARRFFPSRESEEARYRLHRNDPAEPGYRAFLGTFIERAVEPFLERGASVLDFGSGPVNSLSLLLAERGWAATSYDPYFAPGGAWRRRGWGAIALHEVAEHLRQPGRTFAALARLLLPGGILAIRTRFAPDSLEAFESWWYRRDLTHLGFYRPRSFRCLAGALGLELVLLESPDLAVLRKPA
ncbi:MAG TPA: class I SAM-dependent methyltransferase [Rectinemataceae bacterium]|nr:class I SAM-dependent methyltransferase [Rectinemataceae bacterium]